MKNMVDRTNPFAFKMVTPSMGDADQNPQKKQRIDDRTALAKKLLKKDGPKNDLFMIFLQMYALGDFEDVDANEIVAFLDKIFGTDDDSDDDLPHTDIVGDQDKFEIKTIITHLKNVLLDQLNKDKKEQIESKVDFNFLNMSMSSSTESEKDSANLKMFNIQVINQITGSGKAVIIDEAQLHLNKRMAGGIGNKKFVNKIYNHFAENFIFVLSIYNNIEMILMSENEKFMLMLGLKEWRSRSAELEEVSHLIHQYTKNYLDFAIFKAVDLYLASEERSAFFSDLYNEFISPSLKMDFRSKRFQEGKNRVIKNRRHTDSYFNLSLTSELDITARSAIGRDLPALAGGGAPAEDRAGGAAAGNGGRSASAKSGDGSQASPIVL